jgi:hypothetical protein
LQVIDRYCKYADGMIGRWYVKDDGHKAPNVRALVRPLLNLFHGEKMSKRWKTEIDLVLLKKPGPQSVTEVMQKTLHILDDSVLDAPPELAKPAHDLFASQQTGDWPPTQLPPPPEISLPAPQALQQTA